MKTYEIAEQELPQEDLFEDGELDSKQAKNKLNRLFSEGLISLVTYDYYMNSYDWRK